MEKIKSYKKAVKDHFTKHKTAYAAAAGVVYGAALATAITQANTIVQGMRMSNQGWTAVRVTGQEGDVYFAEDLDGTPWSFTEVQNVEAPTE